MRTAHPHSLALVMAAAGWPEGALALRRAAADEQLAARVPGAHRRRAGAAPRSALLAPDGRVLLANPAGWLGALTEPPARRPCAAPGRRRGGRRAARRRRLDPPARARPPRRQPRPGQPALALELLGHGAAHARARRRRAVALTGRAGELLAVLALHPEGLTGEQMALHLYGEEGDPGPARRSSRLPGGSAAASAPARTGCGPGCGRLPRDRAEAVGAGDLSGALDAYRGPLLPVRRPRASCRRATSWRARSSAPCCRAGGVRCGAGSSLEEGRDDLVAMTRFLEAVGEGDPRHPVIARAARRARTPLGAAGHLGLGDVRRERARRGEQLRTGLDAA